jgi:hypothetical protein
MTRTMYDAVTVANLPASATMVAGYVDGRYANLTAMRKRFPKATIVEIAVSHTSRGMVLDVETGDATPAEAVTWCTKTMADKSNTELTIYCNTSTWPAVKAAFKSAGVTLPQWWEAHYDKVKKLSVGSIAKQYTDGAKYDTSIVADYWPGVDAAPKPKPTPTPTPTPTPEDSDMTPAQAKQLADLHTNLMSINRVGPITDKETHAAGYYLAVAEGHAHEAAEGVLEIETRLSALETSVAAILKAVTAK